MQPKTRQCCPQNRLSSSFHMKIYVSHKDWNFTKWTNVSRNELMFHKRPSGVSNFCWTILPYPPRPESKSVLYSSLTWITVKFDILTILIFNHGQTCPPVLPRPYCLPSTKPASQSVLEFICCNQIYIWDNMILLTVWIQSPHDDPWTSLPDDPVIEASTIDEPHSSFSVLPQVEPGGIVHELSSFDP